MLLHEIKEAFLHLLFPHICAGCGSDLISNQSQLCLHCISNLPKTDFQFHADNAVEKRFWGRLPPMSAAAQFYFTKDSLMQKLIHQFKYKGNKELGLQMGRMMGEKLKQSERFYADALIPLPLFPAKEKRRGYNQAAVLCEGIAEIMKLPVIKNAVIRPQHTETQTKKGRIERWKNIEGKFLLSRPELLRNKSLLLVDDVITTGATIEACGMEILKAGKIKLSVAALCYSVK